VWFQDRGSELRDRRAARIDRRARADEGDLARGADGRPAREAGEHDVAAERLLLDRDLDVPATSATRASLDTASSLPSGARKTTLGASVRADRAARRTASRWRGRVRVDEYVEPPRRAGRSLALDREPGQRVAHLGRAERDPARVVDLRARAEAGELRPRFAGRRVAAHGDGAQAVRVGDEDAAPADGAAAARIVRVGDRDGGDLRRERDVARLVDARLADDVEERRARRHGRRIARARQRRQLAVARAEDADAARAAGDVGAEDDVAAVVQVRGGERPPGEEAVVLPRRGSPSTIGVAVPSARR
jgi:hypothetical protein